MVRGKVIRFDEARGYGFIAPEGGGEDVFVHANSLNEEDKHSLSPGVPVEFEVSEGDRGLKAFAVRILAKSPAPVVQPVVQPVVHTTEVPHSSAVSFSDEGLCDVLPVEELKRELTELLLSSVPTLTAAQVVSVRQCMMDIAGKYGWVEN